MVMEEEETDEDEADEVDEGVELMNKLKSAGLEKAVGGGARVAPEAAPRTAPAPVRAPEAAPAPAKAAAAEKKSAWGGDMD